ncbi:beta-aspartyl-dipeptidase (metallo-type) [Thermoanaerobacter thermohydrosulfuricus]|uniref:Isoaspartyl dipeptidase n=3 Tax=Thermoanaerobacter TaxID=1754 RepID=I9AFM4_9THEO|nr:MULTISPECIES: beta-aspartyl-peptidase [Thermoanaerobacter]AEM78354.1 isoaspartyl dipeptidase [Thermoanaerobacter wiegelii Rt8.B1]EGD51677.1 isoaspartyl dipeptidase [Thermoanaerobacter ethanolicus JW 200]EIW00822.1 isoaspartyl dipeptidase IadA [Thermoanaerobacter siderophilus SR4]SDF47585.1 beta-aspartyl-dipeptidase (metallo-type) [Thermoanaerobacter thermohydrosulfuricus]
MFLLLKGGEVYSPQPLGRKDILICNGKIIRIADEIKPMKEFGNVEIVDLQGFIIVPGFIDQHVHIAGGGGEGGPVTRTPEITLSDITKGGITTVVGLLGADGITRSMASLLAKARALEQEGITTYIYTGAYELPTRTLTGSVRSDLVLIDKVIGTGEIAISDHRSAQPTTEDLTKLAAEARVGGLLGGKPGIVHLHVGDGIRGLSPLFEIVENTEIPITQFVPTHINRIGHLFEQGLKFIEMGGVIDLTSDIKPDAHTKTALTPKEAIKKIIENKLPIEKVTMSSDSNGSIPVFDENKRLVKVMVGSAQTLYRDLREVIVEGILPIEQAIKIITENVAKVLNLYPNKGCIKEKSDGDIVVLDSNLNIHSVIAKGVFMIKDKKIVKKSMFEE